MVALGMPTDKPDWQKKTIDFDSSKWPSVKFMAATEKKTIREWLDALITEACRKYKGK